MFIIDVSEARGDLSKRDQFLQENQAFAAKIASMHCRRPLEWGRDEELSIALIALNTAIDSYDPERQASFETFASLIIRRRLIDFRRRGQRHASNEFPVDTIPEWHAPAEDPELQRLDRVWELEELQRVATELKVSFDDLVKESPRQPRVRERMLRVVRLICADCELHQEIITRGRLPLERLAALTGETVKVLAKRRRYLMLLLMVSARKKEFPFVLSYIGLGGEEDV